MADIIKANYNGRVRQYALGQIVLNKDVAQIGQDTGGETYTEPWNGGTDTKPLVVFGVVEGVSKADGQQNDQLDSQSDSVKIWLPADTSVYLDGEPVPLVDKNLNPINGIYELNSLGEWFCFLYQENDNVKCMIAQKKDEPESTLESYQIGTYNKDGKHGQCLYGSLVLFSHQYPKPFGISYQGQTNVDGQPDSGEEQTMATFSLTNCYVQIGGYSVYENKFDNIVCEEGFICAKIKTSDLTLSCETHESYALLKEAQKDINYIIFPLYQIHQGRVVCDLRALPSAGMLEAIPESAEADDESDAEATPDTSETNAN